MVNYNFNGLQFSDKKGPNDWNFSYFKIIKNLIFTVLLGGNIMYVQYLLFYQDKTAWSYPNAFYMTTIIIYFISAATTTSFSIRMHKINEETNSSNSIITIIIVGGVLIAIHMYFSTYMHINLQKSEEYLTITAFKVIYIILFAPLFLFLQITSFLRRVAMTQYGFQCKFANSEEKKAEFYQLLINAEVDADFISIFDCYLRAAPQLIAQFAIIIHNQWDINNISALQQVFIITAVALTPWSITSFQGSLRQQQRVELPWKTKAIFFFWHFFIMASRIASVSGAVAFWPVYVGTLIVIHCVGMTTWLFLTTEPTHFCNDNKFWHFVFCCVFGSVYFFSPINLVDQPTRSKYCWFYALIFVENVVAVIVWFVAEDDLSLTYKIVFLGFSIVPFIYGICFMLIYYTKFHPNNNLEINFENTDIPKEDCELNMTLSMF